MPHPTEGSIDEVIGLVYSTEALMALWGVSRSSVRSAAEEGQVLALSVEDRALFPVFQFDGSTVRPEVMEVVAVLRSAVDPFTIAQWLQTPKAEDSEGRTPLVLLDAGENEVVLRDARRAAARWSK